MKVQRTGNTTKLWLSGNDTYEWAYGGTWPCAFLSGKRLFVEFAANGDLIDLNIDSGYGDQDCPADELNMIVTDFLGSAHPTL